MAIQSDHAPTLLHIPSMKEEQSQDRGYWKFNNSLTKDDRFVESLKSYIKNFEPSFTEKSETRRTASEKKVCVLEKQVVVTKGNREFIVAEYENAKIELEKLYDYITDGITLRSKAHWYDEGEKITKYFCL